MDTRKNVMHILGIALIVSTIRLDRDVKDVFKDIMEIRHLVEFLELASLVRVRQ
jgi:hypothetical protein